MKSHCLCWKRCIIFWKKFLCYWDVVNVCDQADVSICEVRNAELLFPFCKTIIVTCKHFYKLFTSFGSAGVAQWVAWLVWLIWVGFGSQEEWRVRHHIHTVSWDHIASCPLGTVGRDTFPANKTTNSQGDCTLKLWMHGFIFGLHVSLWHLFYTSFLISVFHAHALMMIFTLIETVTVNFHLIWLADSFDGVLVERFVCAHCHAWQLSHAFSVHCISVKWNRSLLRMLTCAVLLVGPGVARMTRSDGGKMWNSCSIRVTAWALGILICCWKRHVLSVEQDQFNAITVYVATWGTIVQGALKRVVRFQILHVQYFVCIPYLRFIVRIMHK